jgi:(1->4)-alpha-D-glucan 1-alpha-D-glucosylmutase
MFLGPFMTPPIVPTATYRVQLTAQFGFREAAALVPYLKALGISHLYASPFLKARAGSTHGYDIVDHGELNPEFGGEEGFAELSAALGNAGMGLILDFVPNHMGIGKADNQWWLDVLEWGPRSPYAESFDIDWSTLPFRREGGLLLPILGNSYGEALESGEIELKYDADEGSFSAWYYDHRLPIRPNRYNDILKTVVAAAGADKEPAGRALLDLAGRHSEPGAPSRMQAPEFKRAIAAVHGGADVIARGLEAYRADPSDPSRIVLLHRLLERQHYRLAFWRVAGSEINYRRFFDVNDLAGIRVEDPRTFHESHELVARLIREGRLHGLRLDHVDGLYDPVQYARRLQRLIRFDHEDDPRFRHFYVVAEKILAEGEPMPSLPGVAGTTGYDLVNDITRVLLDADGLPALDRTWAEQGGARRFAAVVRDAKLRVLETLLSSEFTVLTRLLGRIAAGHWRSRDYTMDRLRAALRGYIVNFPVYRTYVSGLTVSERDRGIIERTIAAARNEWHGADAVVLDFLADVLTLDILRRRSGYSSARVRRFVGKVQQLTGPVTAKALEDTSFYRFHRLLALNEVGGEPSLGGLTVMDFHERMRARAAATPLAMSATATHDTKRGEDARTRILAIAELASEWGEAVQRWAAMNAGRRTGGRPTAAHEYMLYQALIGAWLAGGVDEDFVARIKAYAIKAAREGKQETSWLNPSEGYENALSEFIGAILAGEDFAADFDAFARRAALLGALTSLSQLVLKATLPGVPDFYQGTEFWDLSLVDPDNRRRVDFQARVAALEEAATPDWGRLAADWPSGHIKLAVATRLLALRAGDKPLFEHGRYVPLEVRGRDAERIIAYARVEGRRAIVVAAGRHFAHASDGGRHWPTGEDWDAEIVLDDFHVADESLTGGRPGGRISDLFACLPVAVLRARRR